MGTALTGNRNRRAPLCVKMKPNPSNKGSRKPNVRQHDGRRNLDRSAGLSD
jgi:hypothetical protein